MEYMEDIDVLIMERLDGRPLLELDPLDMRVLDDAIELVAALHDSNARPEKPRGAARITRSLRRKARAVAAAASPYKEEYAATVDALEGTGVEDAELVPCHGDFSPRNVLVAPQGLALIDWDRLRRADPARDIAYMGCWYWASTIRRGDPPDWSVLDRITARYEELRPGAGLAGRLNFHIAAGLLRMAHSRIMNRGSEGYLVPYLIREALCTVR
jgi:aminoglycoside phosphotransferase (APT) family kinase protein